MENVIKPLNITCERCGNEFTMSPAEQKFYKSKDFYLPKKCPACRKLRTEVEVLTCIDCNDTFEINKIEREYYEEHNLQIPKRCKNCRSLKVQRNANN